MNTIRFYTDSDYETYSNWAKLRNFPAVPKQYLPKIGFIDEKHCVGFLYRTDSEIAWLEWIVSNPLSDKEERNQAMNAMIEAALSEAKRLGFTMVFTSVEHVGLIERYKSHGFIPTDKNMNNMIRGL